MNYKPPIPHDLKVGDSTIRTVYFESMHVLIGDKKYRVGATEVMPNGDCLHFMRNMETNIARDVTGATIRSWIDK